MKNLILAVLLLGVALPVGAQVGGLNGAVGGTKGQVGDLKGKPAGKEEKPKVALQNRVLQVLKNGLLMSAPSSPYLLKGYPKDEVVTDGVWLKFYGQDSGATAEYVDLMGAKRTVKVITYKGKLIGTPASR